MTKRLIVDEERRLGVNLPGLLRTRLLASNGGMCTVDGEAWTLCSIPADTPADVRNGRRTFSEATDAMQAEHGDCAPAGLVLAERIIGPGILLLTPTGRLATWDPSTEVTTPARVTWAPPVPEDRRRRVPAPITAAVERVRGLSGCAAVFALPGLEPRVVVARSSAWVLATASGGEALPAGALAALGGTIDPQLIALGWRHHPDWGWAQEWPATVSTTAITRVIADTFEHAYGLRLDMVEMRLEPAA